MIVAVAEMDERDQRDAWGQMEAECLDILPHRRRMRVLELADDSGLSEFQALLVTVLAESLLRTPEPEL